MLASRTLPHRKSTRLKDFDYASPNAVFFVTLCAKEKRQVFTDRDFCEEIIRIIGQEKKRSGFAVYVYCIMPEHMHLLCSPLETGLTVSQFVGGLSSKITRLSWDYGFSGKLLQRSFYDHVVRKNESLLNILAYILNNPVRKGLIGDGKDYPYSGMIDNFPV